jgi:hypothetical protein
MVEAKPYGESTTESGRTYEPRVPQGLREPARWQAAVGALGLVVSLAIVAPAAEAGVRFDLSPMAAATPVEPAETATPVPGHRLIKLSLQLSMMLGPDQDPVENLRVTIRSTDDAVRVADYAPRTELRSRMSGEIDVQQTVETNKHVGLTAAGHYGKMVEASLGGDLGQKDIETLKFKRVAPLHLVAVSGTIDRGRGVSFKLRATATQVLEGDRRFTLTLAVPDDWQGGLLEVDVVAETPHRPFPGMERESQTVGRDFFTVATFTAGDAARRAAAMKLVNAEAELRAVAAEYQEAIRRETKPNLLQHVAVAFDLQRPPLDPSWLNRVLRGEIDSRLQRDLRRLPVDVRVAILDYSDARRRFIQSGVTVRDVATQ